MHSCSTSSLKPIALHHPWLALLSPQGCSHQVLTALDTNDVEYGQLNTIPDVLLHSEALQTSIFVLTYHVK